MSGLKVGGFQAKARPLLPFTDIGPPKPPKPSQQQASSTFTMLPDQTKSAAELTEQALQMTQARAAASPGPSTAAEREEMLTLREKLAEVTGAEKAATARAEAAEAERKQQHEVQAKMAAQLTEALSKASEQQVAAASANASLKVSGHDWLNPLVKRADTWIFRVGCGGSSGDGGGQAVDAGREAIHCHREGWGAPVRAKDHA